MTARIGKGVTALFGIKKIPPRSSARFICALLLACVQGCSFRPVSATSCSVRQGAAESTVLIATLTNNSSKAVRHVGVLVGAMEYEYDFRSPLAAGQTIRDIVGGEYKEPEDNIRITCETAAAPRDCAELKRNGYKMPWPAGLPTLAPLPVSEKPHTGSAAECWARAIVYADGSAWSVSPM